MKCVGKTTVIKKSCELLNSKSLKYHGFFTEEIKRGRERVGFDVVTTEGNRSTLARVSSSDQSSRGLPKVGKYLVDVSSFEKLALPVFDSPVPSVLILDEIGKMELFSHSFSEKTKKAFNEGNFKILATIPIAKKALPFVDELRNRKDCTLVQVTRENRNDLPSEIVEQLLKMK
ncbi:cancer-related nucleoside-triphosphatase homolog isoform X2 [Stegodyphus dumicola]|uniref:cancer-related nucleoside-triphosphatase homolog isoform X2 n=1 Tax=Stegodyphus dumicola TaxID=202533 RepID=UPI0015B26D65|nr:cancer-related nucleoside-triphosphatase homolog isoform X2 [Stegodyphus dumicola]